MRLTLFGARALLFYGVMLGAFFGAPYVNLFFLLIAFLSILWIAALVSTWRNGTGIQAQFGSLASIPAGERATLQASLQAQKRTRFDIEVRLDLGQKQHAIGRVQVLRDSAQIQIVTPELKRGIYPLKAARVSSTYPFGFLRRQVAVDCPSELVVYPLPLEIDAAGRTADDLFREMLGEGLAGSGDLQPSGLRDHRNGDGLRAVNWRASARRGKLVVQEWDGGADQGLEVLLDRRCSHEELEASLRELATLLRLARESKQVLAIRSQGLVETYGEGHQDWEQALRFMAAADLLEPDASAPPPVAPEVLRLPRSLSHA